MDSRKYNLVILDKIQTWFEREREEGSQFGNMTTHLAIDLLRQMITYIVVIFLRFSDYRILLI